MNYSEMKGFFNYYLYKNKQTLTKKNNLKTKKALKNILAQICYNFILIIEKMSPKKNYLTAIFNKKFNRILI